MKRRKTTALILALVLALCMMPVYGTQAAAKKPAIAGTASVLQNGTKALSITKNGYTVTKIVSVKSAANSIARADATKSKLTIYGIKAGKAKITLKLKAKKGKKESSFTLTTTATVKAPKASMSVSALAIGGSTAVKTSNIVSKAGVSYASDNKSAATVDSTGKVKGVGAGTANITVKVSLPKTKYASAKTVSLKAGAITVKERVDYLLDEMTTDQKIAQMIMPAFRSWDGEYVQDLSKAPELAKVLRRHQYGGVILFGQNVSDTEQALKLTEDLQANNAKSTDAAKTGAIPYMISVDQEGGAVARLSMGTRGTGSMAIGATGENARENAGKIGHVFGEELKALGMNVDLAPCIDVIGELSDLGMSTRVYSSNPSKNAELGMAFSEGLGASNIITTYKHFPGAGDGSDYPTSIPISKEELYKNGIDAYKKVIDGGAEMLMTSATTFPNIDDPHLLSDGKTMGYYPVTISPKFITEILRGELGYKGVVMTDALEMDQFITEPDTGVQLFPGTPRTAEYDVTVAKYAINAGCDILLLPQDLNDPARAEYYDKYIAGLVSLVESGDISIDTVNASVRRILELKDKRKILDTLTAQEPAGLSAADIVGSPEHHAVEAETAAQAVTLLKDDGVFPIAGKGKRIVIVGNTESDSTPISYALSQLRAKGLIDADARIENRITRKVEGSKSSDTNIIIDYYFRSGGELAYFDHLSEAIRQADVVIAMSTVAAGNTPLVQLQDDYYVMQGVSRALSEAHEAGAKFVLLSANIPMDTARFEDADAIICAYMAAGFGIDPTARSAGLENTRAFNANVPAAIMAMFDSPEKITGKLPIDIPKMTKNTDGKWEFTDEILFKGQY